MSGGDSSKQQRPIPHLRWWIGALLFASTVIIAAGMVPFLAVILVLLLVRNTRATEEGLVRRI